MGYAGFLQIDLLSLVLSQTESTNLAQPYCKAYCKPPFLQGAKKKKKEPGVSTGVEKSVHAFGE